MATKPHDDDANARDADRKRAAGDKAGSDEAPQAASVAMTRTPEQREAMAAATIGAQVILDYNEDGSIGARGGAGGTIEENTMARDAHLVALGLDPAAPSGPPLTPEQVKAKQDAAAKAADPTFLPSASGKATRVSSLAAGISSEDLPPPPAGSVTGAAAR
jgi:hypothetical protein